MAEFLHVRKQKVYKQRRHPNEDTYKDLYRFEEENVEYLTQVFLRNGEEETRGGTLSKKQKMETTLRYLGDPGFQVGVGEDIGVHQSTVSRTVHTICTKIAEKSAQWIKFPSTEEIMNEAKLQWQEKFDFPYTIGAIDCTHFLIMKPTVHGDEYINRHNQSTLNVQATCNANEWFTSIDARWPGSVHDSRIWRNSAILPIVSSYAGRYLLVADSGYGIAPWLMTPYQNPATAVQLYYNEQHKRNRVIIERCFGQVKKRFPILMNTIRIALPRIPTLILACCILHNVAKFVRDEDFPLQDEFEELNDNNEGDIFHANANIRLMGRLKRDEIAQTLYAMRR